MPQIIIHAEADGRARVKAEMVKDIRKCMVEALDLKEDQGQVLLYEALPIHRAMHSGRKSMVFLEIKMIEGRSENMKQTLAKGITDIVCEAMVLERSQVLCLLEEYKRQAYIGGK